MGLFDNLDPADLKGYVYLNGIGEEVMSVEKVKEKKNRKTGLDQLIIEFKIEKIVNGFEDHEEGEVVSFCKDTHPDFVKKNMAMVGEFLRAATESVSPKTKLENDKQVIAALKAMVSEDQPLRGAKVILTNTPTPRNGKVPNTAFRAA